MANIIIFLILLGFLPQSYAETYLEGCFNHKNLAVQAIQDIQFLKVPTDKIQQKNGCINIYTSEQRIDLYRKYLKMLPLSYWTPKVRCTNMLEMKLSSPGK